MYDGNYPREYWKQRGIGYPGEQIVVYDADGERSWDVICGHGTYGGVEGLLEAMGSAVVDYGKDHDSVAGFLTAQDVINRLESI